MLLQFKKTSFVLTKPAKVKLRQRHYWLTLWSRYLNNLKNSIMFSILSSFLTYSRHVWASALMLYTRGGEGYSGQ